MMNGGILIQMNGKYNITDYLKDDPELQKAVIGEFLKDIERLEKENERLKEDKNRYELYIKEERDNYYKYLRTLKEIREILKGEKDGDIDEMIDKINEVLKEGE